MQPFARTQPSDVETKALESSVATWTAQFKNAVGMPSSLLSVSLVAGSVSVMEHGLGKAFIGYRAVREIGLQAYGQLGDVPQTLPERFIGLTISSGSFVGTVEVF